MTKYSDRVKKWRKNCKARIIESMGGSCVICGYKKCNSALALHHLDPSQKDFGFAGIRANPKAWTTIVKELKKCVLLCHNCHYEVHDGITNIPEKCSTFNSEYEKYNL